LIESKSIDRPLFARFRAGGYCRGHRIPPHGWNILMRHIRFGTRIGGLVAVCAAVIAVSACTADQTGTQPTPSGTVTVTASGTAGASAVPTDIAGNTQAVCAEVRKLITDGAAQFTRKLTEAISAAQSGGTAADAAVKEIKDLLAQWSTGLRAQSGLAADPALRTALLTEAEVFDRAASKINTPNDLQPAASILTGPEVTQAGQAVQQACGSYWSS
jgi:hypothetical protein